MEKKQYISPTLTSVTFKIERGYALSNGPEHDFLGLFSLEADLESGYNTQGQQNWEEDNGSYFGTGW